MVMALGISGVIIIGLGLVHRLEVLVPGIFLVALIGEMYRPAMQAAMADLVGERDRVRAFGLVYWAINMGYAIGVSLGGLLATRSFLWLFIGDGLTTLVFATLIFTGVPETRPTVVRKQGDDRMHGLAGLLAPYRNPHYVYFLILAFFFTLIFMQNATTLALDMTSRGISKAAFGQCLALNGILIVLVQPFLGPILARFDRPRIIAAGVALMGIGFGWNAVARTVPMYALGVCVWTIGEIGVLPVAHAVVADLAPLPLRGRYMGAYTFAFGLAVCAAPVVGMLVLDRLGSATLWIGCLAVGLLTAVGFLLLSRVMARRKVAAEEPVSAIGA
jgi:MFS family permease